MKKINANKGIYLLLFYYFSFEKNFFVIVKTIVNKALFFHPSITIYFSNISRTVVWKR